MHPKILVVDDHAHNRLIYRDWLREIQGVEIVEAVTGEQALALARELDFAVFLIDVKMPVMDGFQLAFHLRREPRAKDTPIIFVSSEVTERAWTVRGYRVGGADFLPSATAYGEVLVQKARTFVELYRRQQAVAEMAERSRHEADELRARLEDVTRSRDELRRQATHDSVTQLPNRVLFRDRLLAARARAARHRRMLAVGYLDLDRFKGINDRYGHAMGDALLARVASRLSSVVRATDTVARLGGDEFGLLFEDIDCPDHAELAATKALHAVASPHTLVAGHGDGAGDGADGTGHRLTLAIGASLGIALYPDHSREVEGLLFQADMAMYAAKQDGGGVRLYASDLARPVAAAAEMPRPTDRPGEGVTQRH